MIREFDFRDLNEQGLEEIARCYQEQGCFLLTGLDNRITGPLRRVLADAMGAADEVLEEMLDPSVRNAVFPEEVRRKMARVRTTGALAGSLLNTLQPILKRLVGPFVHVSRDFHAQFKGGEQTAVNRGGYAAGSNYMEVHRPYMLHQDFAGASLATSPSAITLWAGLNACPDWNVRFYPASHLQGLLCDRWIGLDDPRLAALGEPVDVRARPGSAILFNALMLHGTSNPGPLRRVSCDIRFFPLCPYLGSEVHLLDSSPCRAMRESLERDARPVLAAPLLEARHYLGEPALRENVPPRSVLNWPNYLYHAFRNDRPSALASLENFVNAEIGTDGGEVYASKYFGRPLSMESLESLLARLTAAEPEALELVGLNRVMAEAAVNQSH